MKRQTKKTSIVTRNKKLAETDSQYFLKLVAVLLLGTFWLKFSQPINIGAVALMGVPIGFLAGLFIISHFEKNQEDRKIWYAILLVATIISMFLPAGIMI